MVQDTSTPMKFSVCRRNRAGLAIGGTWCPQKVPSNLDYSLWPNSICFIIPWGSDSSIPYKSILFTRIVLFITCWETVSWQTVSCSLKNSRYQRLAADKGGPANPSAPAFHLQHKTAQSVETLIYPFSSTFTEIYSTKIVCVLVCFLHFSFTESFKDIFGSVVMLQRVTR